MVRFAPALASGVTGRLALEDAVAGSGSKWSGSFLSGVIQIDRQLKPTAAMARRILGLTQDGLDLNALATYVDRGVFAQSLEPLEYKNARRRLVTEQIEMGVPASRFTLERLSALEELSNLFPRNTSMMPRLLELENEGLNISRTHSALKSEPVKSRLFEKLVAGGATAGAGTR